MHTQTNPHTQALTFWQLICFGGLTAPLAMAGFAFAMFVPTFYAVDMGMGLGLVGMVFAFGRIFDVFSDPVIGYLSDETRSRFGPRIPWMVIGAPGFCVAVWCLLVPPDTANLLYLCIASILYFLFYTIIDVPYSSTGLEISPYTHERTILASSKAVFQIVGALTIGTLPLILASDTAQTLTASAKIIILLTALGLILFLAFVPKRQRTVTVARIGIFSSFQIVWRNHKYRSLIIVFCIVQTANALTAGLTVLFVTHIIKAPDMIGVFFGLMFLSTTLGLPIWVWVSKRYGKLHAWRLSILFGAGTLFCAAFLSEGNILGTVLFSISLGATLGCDAIMPTSMLADIIYADEKDGKSRIGGLSLAVKNAVAKLGFLAPMGLAFPILDLIDFQETGGDNSPSQRLTLIVFYAGLPVLLRFLAAYLLSSKSRRFD